MQNLCELCREEKYFGKPCTYERAYRFIECDECGRETKCHKTWAHSADILKEPSRDQKEVNKALNIAFATENINHYLNQKQTMEKQIKMSLETAREMYRDLNMCPSTHLRNLLEDNFTKEELEGKKGFTWEDSFSGSGWYIDNTSNVHEVKIDVYPKVLSFNKNVFKTKEQAESALAFAQLSHIVPMYNNHPTHPSHKDYYCIMSTGDKLWIRKVVNKEHITTLFFYNEENAATSLEVNKELWEKYHMIQKVTATVIETNIK